jgi:single-strand DNA-binding protein
MVNQATILGRIGKIETKISKSGISYTNMSMVTSKKFMKNGQKEEKVTWHNVTCFGKLSEIAEKYVAVGDMLYIQGEMDSQKYAGQDGIERIKNYVIAGELKLLPKAKEHKSETKPAASYMSDFGDDAIPF